MKTTAFWDIELHSLIEVDRRFRGAYCSHFEGGESLMMEAVSTSETSVFFYETLRRYIPEAVVFR
jgi:hypothetical protein